MSIDEFAKKLKQKASVLKGKSSGYDDSDPNNPRTQQTITNLKSRLVMMKREENVLSSSINNIEYQCRTRVAQYNNQYANVNIRKKKIAGDKALTSLGSKRLLQLGQLKKMETARATIENQLSMIEGAKITVDTVNAMKIGASTLKAIANQVNVEDVVTHSDDIRDDMDKINEVDDEIQSTVQASNPDIDEDSVLDFLMDDVNGEIDTSNDDNSSNIGSFQLANQKQMQQSPSNLVTVDDIPSINVGSRPIRMNKVPNGNNSNPIPFIQKQQSNGIKDPPRSSNKFISNQEYSSNQQALYQEYIPLNSSSHQPLINNYIPVAIPSQPQYNSNGTQINRNVSNRATEISLLEDAFN